MPNSPTGSMYPDNLPVKSVLELIRIVRGNVVVEEKSRFAKEINWVTGFCLKISFGDPDAIEPIGATEADGKAKADLVHALLDLEEAMRGAVNVSKAGLDWVLLVQLVQLLLSLLDGCRE